MDAVAARMAAYERLNAFLDTCEDPAAYRAFAYHAAFPLVLTPELAYDLWSRFRHDVFGRPLNIPWLAVADLLLSPLCRHVGHEGFELNREVRNLLLDECRIMPQYGDYRLNELADFLLAYIKTLSQETGLARNSVDNERWMALAYSRPGDVARQLREAVNEARQAGHTAELIRLSNVAQRLASPLAGEYQPILSYAGGLGERARGDEVAAQEFLADLPGAVEIDGETVPLSGTAAPFDLGQVTVMVLDQDGTPRGTGFVVDSRTVLAAWRVVNLAGRGAVTLRLGQRDFPATVRSSNQPFDIAVLALDEPLPAGTPTLPLSTRTDVGDRAYRSLAVDLATGRFRPLQGRTQQVEFDELGLTATARLNLRAAPNTSAAVVTVLEEGAALTALGDADAARAQVGGRDAWLEVRAAGGTTGFVAAQFLRVRDIPAPRRRLSANALFNGLAGAAVWDDETGEILGMIIEWVDNDDTRAAWAVDAARLRAALAPQDRPLEPPIDLLASLARITVGGQLRGNGFAAGKRLVLTAANVVEGVTDAGPPITLRIAEEDREAVIERLLPELDVALLRTTEPLPAAARALPFVGEEETVTGRSVYGQAYMPEAEAWRELLGTVDGPLATEDGVERLRVAVDLLFPGSSGVPLLDSDSHRVVGMVVAGRELKGSWEAHLVPARDLRGALVQAQETTTLPVDRVEIGFEQLKGPNYRVTARAHRGDQVEAWPSDVEFSADREQALSLAFDPEKYGRWLGGMLFDNESFYMPLRQALENRAAPLGVQLALPPGDETLHSLRWEALQPPYDPDPRAIALDSDFRFSRYAAAPSVPFRPPALRRPRAILLVADPTDYPAALGPANEARLRAALAETELSVLSGRLATLDNLANRLSTGDEARVHLLYLSCPGVLSGGEPQLTLVDDEGRSVTRAGRRVLDRLLKPLSPGERPLFILIDAAQSAGQENMSGVGSGRYLNLAAYAVSEYGVPAAVAMLGGGSAAGAVAFAEALFQELLRDGSVDRAVTGARQAVSDPADALVPVLYTSTRDGRLWHPAAADPDEAAPAQEQTATAEDEIEVYASGINAGTGGYAFPPLSLTDLADRLRQAKGPSPADDDAQGRKGYAP